MTHQFFGVGVCVTVIALSFTAYGLCAVRIDDILPSCAKCSQRTAARRGALFYVACLEPGLTVFLSPHFLQMKGKLTKAVFVAKGI